MANTTFVDKSTIIQSSWLQEMNDFFHVLFSGATTVQAARTALGITSSSVIFENTIARTLVLSDAESYIVTSQSSPVTITLPSGIFSAPTTIVISQGGTGQITISPAIGVTLNSASTYKTRAQYSSIGLLQVSTSVWYLVGDIATS